MSIAPAPPVLSGVDEVLAAADAIATLVEPGSAARDRNRTPPLPELRAIADAGLLGIAVPRTHGGPQAPTTTVTELFRVLARADPAVAQLLLAHFVLQSALSRAPTGDPTAARIFTDVLAGAQLGNATAERGTKHGWQHRTTATPDRDGGVRLTGTKYYATGALGADWIAVGALRAAGHPVTAYVRADAPGLTLALEEWSSFGQRSTHSGRVQLDGVHVPAALVDDRGPRPEAPARTAHGAYDQVLHAAIDVGIARAALEDGAAFVRTRTRPWREAHEERAADEPHVVRRFGELKVRLDALEALLHRGAAAVDRTLDDGEADESLLIEASLAVAAVKALAQESAVDIASGVLELAGTGATDEIHGLDRHWRNARVHTLHDPARWKHVHIGAALLSGTVPPPNDLF